MSLLFSPIQLGNVTLDNRVIIAPMCQYSAQEGCANDWHMIHLGHLALSGAGLLIVEATAVEADGRITPGDLGLWSDDTEAALAKVVQAIRRHSPITLGIQLGHAGRKASSRAPWDGGQQIPVAEGGWIAHAPSAVPHLDSELPPRALDAEGLARIKQAFVDSALRADRLGFEVIELHAAHGYLLHEFLSPISNRRDDAYGGSLENRMRFPLEVFQAVRAALPGKTLGVRVSATDWVEGGWDAGQTVAFAQALKALGCDFMDASSGGVSPRQQITLGAGYQVPFAQKIKRETGLPTMAVGLITEARQAEQILQEEQADMIALARGMLYDPRWAWHAAAELGGQVKAPQQYWRSQPRDQKALFGEIRTGQR
ncbi:NADH:flavin oxidoreductase [Bordetella ansorpii]|uniref:NADH:flavin oxidoreductase n=1 Tax=Bordetella ansorpii TaxID=288768 RepID=A0A157REY9_9BORD|nr:NADH:flavin oxidoreductase/NADH oxidase [Bordetella ansorpii]SAI56533.1 NADH:flavin oxidoreductase [Bordetella ansorpii]